MAPQLVEAEEPKQSMGPAPWRGTHAVFLHGSSRRMILSEKPTTPSPLRGRGRLSGIKPYEPPWPPSPPGGRPPAGVVWPPSGVDECDGAAGLWELPEEGMLGRGAIGGGGAGRGAAG